MNYWGVSKGAGTRNLARGNASWHKPFIVVMAVMVEEVVVVVTLMVAVMVMVVVVALPNPGQALGGQTDPRKLTFASSSSLCFLGGAAAVLNECLVTLFQYDSLERGNPGGLQHPSVGVWREAPHRTPGSI
jgi:hypothetical protein